MRVTHNAPPNDMLFCLTFTAGVYFNYPHQRYHLLKTRGILFRCCPSFRLSVRDVVRSLSQTIFLLSSPDFVLMLVTIVPCPRLITSQMGETLLDYGPWSMQNWLYISLVRSWIFIDGNNIFARFNSQHWPRHFSVYAIEFSIICIYFVHSLGQKVILFSPKSIKSCGVVIYQPCLKTNDKH